MTIITKGMDRFLTKSIAHVSGLIGIIPLYEFKGVFAKTGLRVMAKFEWIQLDGIVKSRPAFNIIKQAIESED